MPLANALKAISLDTYEAGLRQVFAKDPDYSYLHDYEALTELPPYLERRFSTLEKVDAMMLATFGSGALTAVGGLVQSVLELNRNGESDAAQMLDAELKAISTAGLGFAAIDVMQMPTGRLEMQHRDRYSRYPAFRFADRILYEMLPHPTPINAELDEAVSPVAVQFIGGSIMALRSIVQYAETQ